MANIQMGITEKCFTTKEMSIIQAFYSPNKESV